MRTQYLSIDPWLRTIMNDVALLPLDTTVPGDVVGFVVDSRHPFFRAGDVVQGLLGWQQYAAAPWYVLRKIAVSAAPITTALGLLGSSGLTAYVGLFHVGRIRAGESVVVSAAAGAVVDEKISYLPHELRLDAALNYRAEPAWSTQTRGAQSVRRRCLLRQRRRPRQ